MITRTHVNVPNLLKHCGYVGYLCTFNPNQVTKYKQAGGSRGEESSGIIEITDRNPKLEPKPD